MRNINVNIFSVIYLINLKQHQLLTASAVFMMGSMSAVYRLRWMFVSEKEKSTGSVPSNCCRKTHCPCAADKSSVWSHEEVLIRWGTACSGSPEPSNDGENSSPRDAVGFQFKGLLFSNPNSKHDSLNSYKMFSFSLLCDCRTANK